MMTLQSHARLLVLHQQRAKRHDIVDQSPEFRTSNSCGILTAPTSRLSSRNESHEHENATLDNVIRVEADTTGMALTHILIKV